jgi:tetratricopeptide (TPR) repeat protein
MMHKAVAQLPSAAMYFNLGNMLYRRGEVEGARQALEASLEIAPRFYNGLSLLAQLELVSGDPERAAGYYEELVSRSPATAELSNTGLAYLLIGRYHDAARRFRQALELAPDSPSALLNLADAELLVGREVEAKAHYRQLLKAIERDPQPEKLLTVRAQAQAHLGHVSEALEAVHEALRLAPESTSTAYEASLVFAVLGDRASGLWHAQRALALGLDPHWFNFPWFDTVRADLPETVR